MKTNVSLHINFDGRCQQAFEFYQTHLGAQIGHLITYRQSALANDTLERWQDKILHGNIQIGSLSLVAADLQPNQYQKPSGFNILLSSNCEEEVNERFNKLSIGGEIIMRPCETFWSPCYAIVVDQFGVPWKLNCAQSPQISEG